jgi:ketosteroid isomerase-like protein
MAEHPNAQLWRKASAGFVRSDSNVGEARSFYSGDVVYHVPGANPLAGDHEGLEAVAALMLKFRKMNVRIVEVHDVLANDEHVVALVRGTASREGRELNLNQANIYNIRDGKITEAWLLPTDQRAVDEFFS